MSERKSKLYLLSFAVFGGVSYGRRPTCCAAVFANGEFELLSDRRDLEVVVNGVDPVWPQAQIEPQLVAGWGVGELVYVVET